MYSQTLNDNLALKPSCPGGRTSHAYRLYVQGIPNVPKYLQYYYTLQQRVDDQMFKVLTASRIRGSTTNTIVIFTSDHGDYLTAHGNMHQKWYGAYDEVVRVPCVISNPKMFPRPETVDATTNHVDLIPTMLGLAGHRPRADPPGSSPRASPTRSGLVGGTCPAS